MTRVDERRRTSAGSEIAGLPFEATSGSSSNSNNTSCGSSEDESSSILDVDAQCEATATLSIESCVYRGEGNANIVIALPHEHKVIRFRKSLAGVASPDGGKARVQRELEFVRDVVSGFLGSYARVPEILRYDTRDIARLSEAIRTFRPENRRHKDIADEYATKFPDYAFLPSRMKLEPAAFRNKSTFCVEIKPKQGFLRKVDQRFQKCPYCLTQYYKLKKKTIVARNSYCPLDLFSGDEERMKTALRGLLESPQNNLKIFKDGIVVYDQGSSSNDLAYVLADWFRSIAPCTSSDAYVDVFCSLVCSTLLRPYPQEVEYASHRQPKKSHSFAGCSIRLPSNKDSELRGCINPDLAAKARKLLYFVREHCNYEAEDLPEDSVLERILRMQRLPYGGTERIYEIYSKYSTFLSDEIIYSDTTLPNESYEEQTIHSMSPGTPMSTVIEAEETAKRKYTWSSLKKLSASIKIYEEDPNGNQQAVIPMESAWTPDEDKNKDKDNKASLTPAPAPYQLLRRSDNVYKQKFHDKGKNDSDDKKVCNLIDVENLLALRNYLLFCTARDCSILMAFQELNTKEVTTVPQQHIIKASEDLWFLTHIGISDVDPKSIHCIEKHRQRDVEVLNAVISVVEGELAMKNQWSTHNRYREIQY